MMRQDTVRDCGWRMADCGLRKRAGHVGSVFFMLVMAASVASAGPVGMPRQTITLPANTTAPIFVDVEGRGRANLLTLEPVEKKILNYRQLPGGFNRSPDQSIPLPPQTAWVTVADVDAAPGLELLFSTAKGLVYLRQKGGVFETEPRTLIETNQSFANFDFPALTLLATNKAGFAIPVVSGNRVTLHRRSSTYEWSPDPSVTLSHQKTTWARDPDTWALAGNSAHSMFVQTTLREKAATNQDDSLENEAIRRLLDEMNNTPNGSPPRLDWVDVAGRGKEDAVVWQVTERMDLRTDLCLFLRGADQKLPDKPSQVLHCSGFPIPVGSTWEWSPVVDLHGDGARELVLLEMKTGAITTTSGLVEMALSHGLDWSLTVRNFHNGAFSQRPDAAVPLTMVLPAELLHQWTIFVSGDFNGDGRPDLLVRRSDTQWNIFLSTTDGRCFMPQPALTFDAPARGFIEIADLNGDGLSDVVWHEPDENRLSIFVTPPQPKP